MFQRDGNRHTIPQVDNFEASEPTRPRDVKVGDRIAVSWSASHKVIGVCESRNGAHIELRTPSGVVYEVHRVSPVPVIH